MELLSPNHHSHWVYHTMMNDTSGALDLRMRRNVIGYLDVQPVTYKALSARYSTIGGAYSHSASAFRQDGESSSTGCYTERALDHYNDQQLCSDQWCAPAADTNTDGVSRRLQEVPEYIADSLTRVSPPMGASSPSRTRHSSHMDSPIMITPIPGTTSSSPVMTHTTPTIIRPSPTMPKPSPAITGHCPKVTIPMPTMPRSGLATERPVTNQLPLSGIENTPNCGESISGEGMVSPHLLSSPHSRISKPFGFWRDVSDETKGHCTAGPQEAGMAAAQMHWTEREESPHERKTVISRSTSQPVYTTGYTKPTRQDDLRRQDRSMSMVSLNRQDGVGPEYGNPTGCRCTDIYHRGKLTHDGTLHATPGRCSMCRVRKTSSSSMGPPQDTYPPLVSTDSKDRSSASDMIRVMSESLSCVNRFHGDPNIANSYPVGQHVHIKEGQGLTPKDNHYWAVKSTELPERRKSQPPPPSTMPSTHTHNTTSFSPVLLLPSEHSLESRLRPSYSSCRNLVRMVTQSLLEDSSDSIPTTPTSTHPTCSPNNYPAMSKSSNDSLSPNLLRQNLGALPAGFDPASFPANLSHCPEVDQMDCSSSSSSSSGSCFEQLLPTSKPEELLPIPRHVLESSSDSETMPMEEEDGGPGRPIRPVDRMPMRHWLLEQLDRNDVPGLEWLVKRELVFRVPWKHGSRHGWTLEHDACLFVRWAKYTGRLSRHSQPDARRMKANFRSALNSLPDVEQVKGMSRMRGQDAFRVYRFLQTKKRVTK